jgi:hypothetical protein
VRAQLSANGRHSGLGRARNARTRTRFSAGSFPSRSARWDLSQKRPNHHGKEGLIGSSPMLGSSEGGVIGSRLKAQALTAPAVGRPNNVRCHRRSAEVARPFAPVAPDARFDQAPRVALARADPIRSEARTA